MTAQLIDGNALAAHPPAGAKPHRGPQGARRAARAAVLLVGDDPASQVYVRNKVKDSTETGLAATLERLPADLTEADLLARVHALNNDPAVHGILVQLPLPKHIDTHKVIEAISRPRTWTAFTWPTPAR
jgi:methylenetetrahydrofolate dehydrogenase (NADP+)/methenyltetrahydrofolate cyclohydrolase